MAMPYTHINWHLFFSSQSSDCHKFIHKSILNNHPHTPAAFAIADTASLSLMLCILAYKFTESIGRNPHTLQPNNCRRVSIHALGRLSSWKGHAHASQRPSALVFVACGNRCSIRTLDLTILSRSKSLARVACANGS